MMGMFVGRNDGCMPPLKSWIDYCLPLTKISEGCRLQAYPDPEPDGIRWTVGYGATGHGIGPDTVWTQEQADANLRRRLRRVNTYITGLVKVRLSAPERAALVDFVYNVGVAAFKDSTLLSKLNSGDYRGAADQFGRWIYDDGVVLDGLVTRREREKSLFETGDWR